MEKLDLKEKLWGGIFGVVAILAAFFEMYSSGVSTTSIAGAVKDIAGTMVVVVLLITVMRQYLPKKPSNLTEAFHEAMKPVISRYSPLIKKDENGDNGKNIGIEDGSNSIENLIKKSDVKSGVRYNLASNLSAIHDKNSGKYHTFFDFDLKSEIKFIVSKTVFMGRSEEEFVLQGKIISDIRGSIEGKFEIVSMCSSTKDGFKVTLSREMVSNDDVIQVVDVIDRVMLLYIAEYKKS
ncbi:MAG: hypothetical protein Q8S15_06945 [Erysipelotrichaceae bacterium]|nr:hypothetical protein [Erysipelotrichaceae bacterium]